LLVGNMLLLFQLSLIFIFSTELFCRVARILVGAVVCVHFLLVFDDPQQLCVR
jgi:hypothetical protein